MGMLDIRRPDLSRGTNVDQKLQLVLDAVEQMSKQFQHALNHLGEESLSNELKEVLNKLRADQSVAQNAVSKQLLNGIQKELEKKIAGKADAKGKKDGKETDLWALVLALCSGDEAAGSVDSGAAAVNRNGIQLKSGTLTTESGGLAINSDGSLTGKDATFTGSLTGKDASFTESLTARDASFTGSLTGKDATFTGSLTGKDATFTGSLTGKDATFTGSLTGKDASFTGSLTGKDATFTGSLTGKDASFTGNLTKGGKSVLTAGDIVVATSTPASPAAGMIWIEPTTNNAGWNTCTVHYYKG